MCKIFLLCPRLHQYNCSESNMIIIVIISIRVFIIITKLLGTKPGTKLSILKQIETIAVCANLRSLNPLQGGLDP